MTSLPAELEKYRSVLEKQAAPIVGVAPMTLSNWKSQGRGPSYRKIGRSIFYPLWELLTWRDAHRVDPEGR
jgi:hypothetical protein